MKTIKNIIYPALALFAVACFALSPQAGAVCQQGCNANSNTVLGDDALVNNTTGGDNTATGLEALLNNTTGSFNTANGFDALYRNTTGSNSSEFGSMAFSIFFFNVGFESRLLSAIVFRTLTPTL